MPALGTTLEALKKEVFEAEVIRDEQEDDNQSPLEVGGGGDAIMEDAIEQRGESPCPKATSSEDVFGDEDFSQ